MKKILVILLGFLLIVSGTFLVARPLEAFSILGYFIGASMFVNGIANIYLWFILKKDGRVNFWYLVSAILSVIFAIAVCSDIFFKIAFETVLLYIVAIWFIATGICRIILSFQVRKVYKEGFYLSGKSWWIVLLLGILLIICGIISIINPLLFAIAIGLNLSINMICCGVDLIALATLI